MDGSELRKKLKFCGFSQVAFAKTVGVTPRAVQMWVQNDRKIPGPVIAYLRTFTMLNDGSKYNELSF